MSAAKAGHEQLKSMRTTPARRGQRIARGLLAHLLAGHARPKCPPHFVGDGHTADSFVVRDRFYARAGFEPCAPFGSCRHSSRGTFMTLTVA